MKKPLRILGLLVIDIVMVAMEFPVLWAEWQDSSVWMLRFYTQSSNVLAMMVCALCAASEIVCLIGRRLLPWWRKDSGMCLRAA